MPKFTVQIEMTYTADYEVEADTADAAVDKVWDSDNYRIIGGERVSSGEEAATGLSDVMEDDD